MSLVSGSIGGESFSMPSGIPDDNSSSGGANTTNDEDMPDFAPDPSPDVSPDLTEPDTGPRSDPVTIPPRIKEKAKGNKSKREDKATTCNEMEEAGCKKNVAPEKDTSKDDPPSTTSTPRKNSGDSGTDKSDPPEVEVTSGPPDLTMGGLDNTQISILVLVAVGLYTFW
jgi:hypothetical protein